MCNAVPADFQDCSIGCGGLREADVSCSAGSIGEGCSRCWEAQESPSALSGLRGLSSSLSRRSPWSGSALKRIGRGAFRGCDKLRELEIPASVEEIGEGCFGEVRHLQVVASCSSLSRVTFASGSALKRIGKEAFRGCDKLLELEIPAGVEEIGEGWFSCSSLSRVTFASGSALKRIGKEAFSWCKELRELEISASIEICGGIGARGRRVFGGQE